MTNEIKAQITVNVSDKDLNDILDIASYGGITYWCGDIEVKEWLEGAVYKCDNVALGGTITFCDCETDDKWDLNKEMLLTGIQKMIENPEYYMPIEYDDEEKCVKICMHAVDADVADAIVQFALFGRIVFA